MEPDIDPSASLESAAPALYVSHWFNTPEPTSLAALRGRVVALHTFQMLCPGCVMHGLPQAVRLREAFPEDQLAVIGLHTVFEHHAVMGPAALQAFIHEYRLDFPIGVDEADPHSPIPRTMAAWGWRGTPSLVLLDREGRVRFNHFGRIDDMALGAFVGQLSERSFPTEPHQLQASDEAGCGGDVCAVRQPSSSSKESP